MVFKVRFDFFFIRKLRVFNFLFVVVIINGVELLLFFELIFSLRDNNFLMIIKFLFCVVVCSIFYLLLFFKVGFEFFFIRNLNVFYLLLVVVVSNGVELLLFFELILIFLDNNVLMIKMFLVFVVE